MESSKFNIGDFVKVPGKGSKGAKVILFGKIVQIVNEGRFIQVRIGERRPIFYNAVDVRPINEV